MTQPGTHNCRIQLFGALRLTDQEHVITHFRLQKAAHLLAYLALNPRRLHPREELIDLFWPDLELEAGRNNLNTTLASLKRNLELPGGVDSLVLLATRQTIGLRAQQVTTDVAEFEALLKQARSAATIAERALLLEGAINLYHGDLLAGCYEDWALRAQSAYRERYCEALLAWAQDLETQQEWQAAREAAKRAVEADPLRETATLVLMRVQARQGQTVQAIETFRALQDRLREEMDIEPTRELRELCERLQHDPDALFSQSPTQPLSGTASSTAAHDEQRRHGPLPHPEEMPSSPPDTESLEWVTFPVSVGGAVPLGSPDYIVRPEDAIFQAAIQRRDSIVLVKGPGQVGKTSLLARGIDEARKNGATIVMTDLQKLSASDWQSLDGFYQALAQKIADQLDLEVSSANVWSAARSSNSNFERFVQREVLGKLSSPVVWGLDEVDRLFGVPYREDVFSLFRSWHNERALDPGGPWSRLTLAIAYATEAHLFISDLNRSPFNVGTRLTLVDFTFDQVADLNARYRSPLDAKELARFFALVGGNPYLVRRGLQEIVTHSLNMDAVATQADTDEGCFGDYLNRMYVALTQSPTLCDAVRDLLQDRKAIVPESFYRLRSAGLVTRGATQTAEFRCPLYRRYLERYL